METNDSADFREEKPTKAPYSKTSMKVLIV